jgi:TRAP-type C4-dicarboxylate transport system substrate-binding protein
MMRKVLTAISFALAMCVATSASAQTTVSVLGWYPNQPQTEDIEIPFFKGLSKRTGIDLDIKYRNIKELDLSPFQGLRQLQSGVFDIMPMAAGFISGDDPVFIGEDLPGLAFSFDEVKPVIDAWRPVLEERFAKKYDATLLSIAPYPPQIMFCKKGVTGIGDLKGKKIRATSAAASSLIKALGGVGVTLAGPEVYQALQRGVVDCGATGSAYANSNSWFEVSDIIYPVPLGGYSVLTHVARNDFLGKLTPQQKKTFLKEFATLEKDLWQIAQESHEDGIRCNMGKTPCDGKLGKMSFLELSEQDKKGVRQALKDHVLSGWYTDCDRVFPGCSAKWNATVGKATGIVK